MSHPAHIQKWGFSTKDSDRTDLAGCALHSKASSTWGSSVRTRKDAQVAQKGELEVG